MREREKSNSDFADSLWKQGYGYNNPNPERKRQGLKPLNFDDSRDGEKDRGFVNTLVTDMLGCAIENSIHLVFEGAGRLFRRNTVQ